MSEMVVADAAERLGVSHQRVRALIDSGALPARRLGGRWVLDADDVARFAESRGPGRPLSPRMAWGLIGLLDRGEAPELSRSDRARLRPRLRARPSLQDTARLARRRSSVHRFGVHRSAVPRALSWPRLVPTGASAPGQDIVDVGVAELYVPADELAALVDALRARPAEGDANLVARVPAVPLWPFPNGVAGPAAVALDLWDAGDVRSRRTARRLWSAALAADRFEDRRR